MDSVVTVGAKTDDGLVLGLADALAVKARSTGRRELMICIMQDVEC